MAFICTLEPDESVQLTVLKGNGEFIVRAAFGYDDETNHVFSTFVVLAPMAGYTDTKYDLAFSVLEAAIDSDYINDCSDGLSTMRVIQDPTHRAAALALICLSVRHLIDEAAPNVVNMVTHSRDLPEKALRKFHQIAAVFGSNGYQAGMCDPWHGHNIWLMERNDAERV